MHSQIYSDQGHIKACSSRKHAGCTSYKTGQEKLQQVDPNLQVTVTNESSGSTSTGLTQQATNQAVPSVQPQTSGQQVQCLNHPVLGVQQTNFQQPPALVMWSVMWNPNQGQYMMAGMPQPPPQVPWMSVGPSTTWSPPQYLWAMPQQRLPPQAPIMAVSTLVSPSSTQPATQGQGPVTTTMVTMTLPAGSQLQTPIPPDTNDECIVSLGCSM